MKKPVVVLLPLDERPCNYRYPDTMPRADHELKLPPRELLGNKKSPADTAAIADWVTEAATEADAMILSLDMLVYGGIVPSRLHHDNEKTLIARVDLIREIKRINPEMKLYLFGLIMRCPTYSSDDEEPTYYATYGADIHLYGRYTHRERLGLLTEEEAADFERVKRTIDPAALQDYLDRRKTNLAVLMHALSYAADGTADYFIVPQDDAAPYGFTSMDQMIVREYLKANTLHTKTAMYPSADDTGLTLLARATAVFGNLRPKVYVHYASIKGAFTVPICEDRMVGETIKYHILSIGGVQVYSLAEADLVLAVNVGSAMAWKDDPAYTLAYDVERNLAEFVNFIRYALEEKKIVAVADIAYLNQADEELLSLLHREGLLLSVQAYAGWNTSSNTIGTALCQAVRYMVGQDTVGNRRFLLHRYYEDAGYMAHARRAVTEAVLPAMELNYFAVDGPDGAVAAAVKERVERYMNEKYPLLSEHVTALAVRMPWSRMFETELQLTMRDDR